VPAITVSAGQPIRATHNNQYVRWLTGVTKDISTALTITHASEYTLTLTNEVATGNILKLGYGTGTAVAAIVSATAATFSVPTTFVSSVTFSGSLGLTSVQFANGTLTAPSVSWASSTTTGRYLLAAGTMADVVSGTEAVRYSTGTKGAQVTMLAAAAPYSADLGVWIQKTIGATGGDVVLASVEMTQDATSGGAGSIPDSGAFRAIGYNSSATSNNALRAGEFHVIRQTGAGAHANASLWGIECAVHSGAIGNGATKVVGIALYNNDWGGGYTSTQADSAVYIWGDKGWAHGLYYLNETGAVMADINANGIIRMNNAYGNQCEPTYSFALDTDTGFFWGGTNVLAATTGGGERMRIDANGNMILGASTGATTSRLYATGGYIEAAGGLKNGGPWILSSQITPTELSTSTNNYAPTGIDTCSSIQLSSSTAVDLTGLQLTSYTGQTGRRILLINIGGQIITLKHNSGSSSVGNKFNTHTSGDFALGSGETVEVIYTANAVWRTLGSAA
jgi:hypothetical protein